MKLYVAICVMASVCIICAPLGRQKRELHVNTFLYMSYAYARNGNFSSCWVCSHIPTHSRGGIPLRPIPLNLTEVAAWVLHQNSSGPIREGSKAKGTSASYKVDGSGDEGDWESAGYHTRGALRGWYQPSYNRHALPPSLALTNTSRIGRPRGTICLTRSVTGTKGHNMGYSNCTYRLNVTEGAEPSFLRRLQNMMGGGRNWTWSFYPETLSAPAAYNGTYFVCGHRAYPWLPRRWTGSCYLGYVVPFVRQVRTLAEVRTPGRRRRAITPVERLFGVVMFPYGIGRTMDELRNVERVLEQIANDTAEAMETITAEMVAIHTTEIQNRLALDYVLAQNGGTCALIGAECCTYIPDNSENITNLANHIRREVRKLTTPDGEVGWLGGWMSKLGQSIVQGLILIVGICLALYLAVMMIKICMSKLCTTKPIAAGTYINDTTTQFPPATYQKLHLHLQQYDQLQACPRTLAQDDEAVRM